MNKEFENLLMPCEDYADINAGRDLHYFTDLQTKGLPIETGFPLDSMKLIILCLFQKYRNLASEVYSKPSNGS